MFPEVTDYFKTNPIFPKGWRKAWELFGSLQSTTPVMNSGNEKIREQWPRRKPNCSRWCRASLVLSQQLMDKRSCRGRGWQCSLPSQDVPTSPPCFSSLSVPGPQHLHRRALLLPKSANCSFLPTPRGASLELWFTPRSWGHTASTQQRSANFSSKDRAPAIPRDGDTPVTH